MFCRIYFNIMKHILSQLFTVLALFLLSGCATFEEGANQEVNVASFPAGAEIFIDGEPAGITPATLTISRKVAHEVQVQKAGYDTYIDYFTPTPNARSENYVKFGLAEDLGHYVDLQPVSMNIQMRSEFVPQSIGGDPFKTMGQKILEVDRHLEAGLISPVEHKYIVEQIITFFEQ